MISSLRARRPDEPADVSLQFDTVKTDSLGPGLPLPIPLDGLDFNFAAKNDGPPIVSTIQVRSNSPPNTAGRSHLAVILRGSKPPGFTSIYPGSKVKFFALKQLLFACSVTSGGAVPIGPDPTLPSVLVPQPCSALFEGRTVKGKTVQQTAAYAGIGPCAGCFWG